MASKKRDLFAKSALPQPSRLQRPTLELEKIQTDGGTQPRESLDREVIEDYIARMTLDESTGFVLDPEGQKWPELVVFFDGQAHWLADGFHRYSAAREAGLNSFQVRMEEGQLRDAVAFSLGVNATHGKRRTNSDKRRAVERALNDEQWRLWSDPRVGELCKVSSQLVAKIREELEQRQLIPFEEILHGADGREYERARPVISAAPAEAAEPASKPKAAKKPGKKVDPYEQLADTPDQVLDAVIAYPQTLNQWRALAEHVARVLNDDGVLFAHLAPGDPLIWDGPRALEPLLRADALQPPKLCYIQSHDRHYAVWGKRALELSAKLAKPSNALSANSQKLILGTALDRW